MSSKNFDDDSSNHFRDTLNFSTKRQQQIFVPFRTCVFYICKSLFLKTYEEKVAGAYSHLIALLIVSKAAEDEATLTHKTLYSAISYVFNVHINIMSVVIPRTCEEKQGWWKLHSYGCLHCESNLHYESNR